MLLRRLFVSALLASVAATAVACSATVDETDPGAAQDEGAIGGRNLTGSGFGLLDNEIVLTLDDGPGARTIELAEWLAKEKVPAVFFMVGKNAAANPAAVERVVQLSNENNGLFIVANHTMNHQARPLPSLGVRTTINEIMDADRILSPNIKASQKVGYNSSVSFFRPPYGDLLRIGQANIATINQSGGDKYAGPVFWDIGGELKNGFSADWACWGKVSVTTCMDGYIKETKARKKGIMLAHDVHARTVDMLTGTNAAGGRSLIKELRAAGFKFVGLRAHEQAVTSATNRQNALAGNLGATIDADVNVGDNGQVTVEHRTTGGAKVSVAFDSEDGRVGTQASGSTSTTLDAGSHFVTVTVLNAAGTAVKQQSFPFVVGQTIDRASEEATAKENAACVSFSQLDTGAVLRMYTGKVDCSAAGALKPDGVTECYAAKTDLRATRSPQLVGPSEWSLDFDVVSDKSRLFFALDARTGDLEGGRITFPGTSKKENGFAVDRAVCAKGLWYGKIVGSDGKVTDSLVRTLKDPSTGAAVN